MQIQETRNSTQGVGFAQANAASGGMKLGGLDFEAMLGQMEGAGKASPIRTANDWGDLVGGDMSMLMGVGFKPAGDYSLMERDQLEKVKGAYVELLPSFGNIEFGPPVANYDPRIEMLRLAKVELKVQAMEEAGEIDKALDAFIGIHGLKDSLTQDEKAELRERLVNMTKAVLLEDEWRNAYLGAMKTSIDVSIDGLRQYLLGEDESVAMREVNEELPYGDPDLLSFTRDPKWQNFTVEPRVLREMATEMLAEELARQEAEALAASR
ncbi:hypothetical protein VDG1235_2452 [Verrucomicrobiia bacterium DG1235]|nr:hypothetical protein VDG1235_2452 [Verrucomicrobiae bacterium DG1235]